jgi:N-acetylglucosamine-6-phosphate deacetylase
LATKRIIDGRLVLPDGCVTGTTCISGGKIAEIISRPHEPTRGPSTGDEDNYSAAGRYVAPGFIDIHFHGCMGFDITRARGDAIPRLARALLPLGATAYLAGLLWRPGQVGQLAPWVNAPAGGAVMLGLYLEGPFVNPGQLGASPSELCQEPDPAVLDAILGEAGDALRIMTVAPEVDGACAIIEKLAARGIVPSLGHTLCTYDEAMRGIEAGARHATHLFNAMTGLKHRAPGAVGAVLSTEHVTAELIADGIHIHPSVLKVAIGAKGCERIAVITDASPAAGLGPDIPGTLLGEGVSVVDGAPRRPDGTLVNSLLTPITALKNLVTLVGLPVHTAVRMLSLTPATVAGVANSKGSLEQGKDADIVVFDDKFEVWATFVGGELAWERQASSL